MAINRLRFPSIRNPDKYGYTLASDWDDLWTMVRRQPLKFVGNRCGMFETLGDGQVQHAPLRPTTIELMGDYCLSLSKYALNQIGGTWWDEMKFISDKLYNSFHERPRLRGLIKFFSELRYDDHKPKYFSTASDFYLKVSGSSSKSHDKRWQHVPSDADGSAKFVWGMICQEDPSVIADGLSCYAAYEEFRHIATIECEMWVPKNAAEWLELDYQEVDLPFTALKNIVTSAQRLTSASSWVNNMLEWMNESVS